MKAFGIAVCILIAIFAANAAGYCIESACHDDGDGGGAHHCIASCHGGCCSAVLQNHPFTVALSFVSQVITPQALPLKTAFTGGIEHPPKTFSS